MELVKIYNLAYHELLRRRADEEAKAARVKEELGRESEISKNRLAKLDSVKHRRTLHYAWDLPEFERPVTDGIKLLSKYIKAYRHKCFMLVGYNTTFEQDTYRFHRLREYGVDPYVMIYKGPDRKVDESRSFELADVRLEKFARWVNGYFFKKFQFAEYSPWVSAQAGK